MSNEVKKVTTKEFFKQENVISKFKELLGDRSKGFISSILQITTSNKLLSKASPVSIYTAAATAAVLDLPINKDIGYAWIVPYKGEAQFQMGYKGYIQLALRTQQYKKLNAVEIYENQFISFNALTEELNADFTVEGKGKVVGYAAYFVLNSGFEKLVFWSTEKVTKHAKKFSKSFNYSSSPWKSDFNAMALKTVLKSALSKWGILSIDMQTAVQSDQSVQRKEGVYNYPDNGQGGINIKLIDEEKERKRIKQHITSSTNFEALQQVEEFVDKFSLRADYDEKENFLATNQE